MDAVAPASAAAPAPGLSFERRRTFAWKTLLLGATTVSLIPVLLAKQVMAAQVYLVALVLVHVAGIAVIAVGVKRSHIAPDRRGLAIRVIGIALLIGLLALAARGLRSSAADLVFWGSLFAIWALHTLGLALLHIRSGREAAACPFV